LLAYPGSPLAAHGHLTRLKVAQGELSDFDQVATAMRGWAGTRACDAFRPVDAVPTQEIARDVLKKRRALTQAEAASLPAIAPKRALWYEAATFAGLRVTRVAHTDPRVLDIFGAIEQLPGLCPNDRPEGLKRTRPYYDEGVVSCVGANVR
jgi:hypothetical protein